MSWQVAKQSFMITSDFNQNNGISLFVLVLWVFFSSLVLSSMNFTQGLACVKSIQQWQKTSKLLQVFFLSFPSSALTCKCYDRKKEGILNCVPHISFVPFLSQFLKCVQSIKLAVHGYLICQAFFFVSTWLDYGPATAGKTKNIV